MPSIEIRPVNLADMVVLAKIDHDFQTTHVWQMDRSIGVGNVVVNFHEIRLPRPVKVEYPHTPQFSEQTWISQGVLLAGILNGIPAGYIRLQENAITKTVWVSDLAVREDVRRQGIASGLVVAAQDYTIQRGLKRLILEMQAKNYPAIRMAIKLGYEFCGYNDHFYANQDIAIFFARYLR